MMGLRASWKADAHSTPRCPRRPAFRFRRPSSEFSATSDEDSYVGGSGEWATGADDDDDYEDECVAETWRDGGVLSEADA